MKSDFKGRLLSKMLMMATEAHHGQFDLSNRPYILHCLAVMHHLKSDDEELNCIALGHDLIEDTNVTVVDLCKAGMTERIVKGIQDLTKDKNAIDEIYRKQVKSNPDAILVKMADLLHNSDIRRLKGLTAKDITRTIEYHVFYTELKNLVSGQ